MYELSYGHPGAQSPPIAVVGGDNNSDGDGGGGGGVCVCVVVEGGVRQWCVLDMMTMKNS
jgi:hypothetical protein